MSYNYSIELESARKVKAALPYLILMRGPTAKPCPIHGHNYGIILPADDPYWDQHPMRENKDCKCSIRSLSRSEYANIIAKRCG